MESIAHEYGQRVMPHFASFNAQNIKSSAQNAKPTDLSTKSSSKTSHRPSRDSGEEPRSKIVKRDREVFTIKVDAPVPSPSTSSTASRSSTASPQPTTSSPTSSTVSKPKPSPISLDSSLMSHLSTSSSYLPIPISPTKISPFKFTALPTPLMVPSPIMGPRAPLLHFWSSLSPVTTMSPRFGPAFQFPGFFNGQIPFPPVTISSSSAMENLATPGVPSPTRTIQVP
ncbi:hypothetical protein LOTGIDRAFT_153897 [Lottia gigantea]|uniref:Uncharacterized protein n=1 Tax=Lottia gigantea TaxID=225164 RepID=V3ZJK1_LOTGI|nr:hypothetical protein LOTGIDRAFT_153897 [Lottia gigantea]ESO91453.1 hypothetical protein LOTGIDRAFT_153897 [Lottia gigantea]